MVITEEDAQLAIANLFATTILMRTAVKGRPNAVQTNKQCF